MLESRWGDCGTGYIVIVMDPDTSGRTWENVAATAQELACITSPQLVDGVLFVAPWGKEEGTTTQADHIESCKRETLLLAEAALAPQTPPVVTLRS